VPGFKPRADVAARRAEVLRLRIACKPYAEIAAQLGIKPSTARADYRIGLENYAAEQRASAHLNVDRELAKLDQMEAAVTKVLEAKHYTVSNGTLICHGNAPLEDDAHVLAAVDRLVKIAQRRARLLGLDAPVEIRVSDAVDAEIAALAAQIAQLPPPPAEVPR
jgi:hypothetical protein